MHAASEPFTISIREEIPCDVPAREAMLDRALGMRRKRKSSEKLRRGRLPAEGLAFSAITQNGQLAGTVRLWNVAAGGRAALLLGPLAADPQLQGAGIGSALMRHAIARAQALGHDAILLVGDAAYYQRFGFVPAPGALFMPGPFERSRFLMLELKEGALSGASGILKATGRAIEPARAQQRRAA